ncbi:hypothetical protein [Solibacillus sp. FSL H8-0538]|uniref:hypothetical protein n=1 Tax=Solibacillus sp. FSL H8-0538 TaxID=2921400 RepID=UPI0030FCA352
MRIVTLYKPDDSDELILAGHKKDEGILVLTATRGLSFTQSYTVQQELVARNWYSDNPRAVVTIEWDA